MQKYLLSVVIEKDEEGYFAYCPNLQGCYTQGNTYEEALKNIEDAVKLHLEDRLSEKEKVPKADSVSVSAIEVTV